MARYLPLRVTTTPETIDDKEAPRENGIILRRVNSHAAEASNIVLT